MKVRQKANPAITGEASRFNTHGLGEIIVGFDGGDMDSCYITDYEVLLPEKGWVDMQEAFRTHDLITDNYAERFTTPQTREERERGWYR